MTDVPSNKRLFPDFGGGYTLGLLICGITILGGYYLLRIEPWKLGFGMLIAAIVFLLIVEFDQ